MNKNTLLLRHLLRIFACCAAVGACRSALAQQSPGWQFDRDVNHDALPTAPPGFEVSFFAREPLVRQPCSMAFDAKGRLCVGMGPQYRNPKPNTPGDSVVLVLDTDGDGKADRTKTFATGFNAIQGLAWHGRDLWVANAPDLTVVRDLDGDDEADEYVRVFTDLGNLEHGLHGLNWAPDGKLYMSKGNSKGLTQPGRIAPKAFRELWGVTAPAGSPGFPAPRTFKKGEYQKAYHDPEDDWGREGGVLRCNDGGRDLEIVSRGMRNPWDITFDSSFNWLGTDNDQNEGDRVLSPFYGAHFGWNHPWSTSWSGAGNLPTTPISAPVFHGSGTGIIFYDAPQFPPEFRRVFFVNDWLLKTTFAYRPRWDGALMQPTGGQWQPFISGGAGLFRPTDLEVGPDGALWCLGWSSGYGVEWKDGRANGEMLNEGRVFRIAWTNAPVAWWNSAKRGKPLAQWNVTELIEDFAGPLPVWRSDAQDEVVRRNTSVKRDLIAGLASGTLTEAQETWAAWTLGRIAPEDARVDEWFATPKASQNLAMQSLRILAHRSRITQRPLPDAIARALTNSEPRLRFEAVQAIWQANQTQFLRPLKALAARETDRLTYYCAWNALGAFASTNQLAAMLDDARGGLRAAALLALASRDALDEATASRLLTDPHSPASTTAALWITKHRGSSLVLLSPGEGGFEREVTVNLERSFKPSDIRYTLDGSTPTLRSPTFDGPRLVIRETTTLKAALFVNNEMIGRPVEAVYRKAGETGPVTSLLQPQSTPTTIEHVLPLLAKADGKRGEELFFSAGGAGCFNCHRVGARGNNFAPDLTGLGQRTEARHVIESILAPNAVITEGFNTLNVETPDAEYSGVLLEESGVALTLGLATGQRQIIPKSKLTSRKTAAGSAMPAYDTLLAPHYAADLAAYLLAQKGLASGIARPEVSSAPAVLSDARRSPDATPSVAPTAWPKGDGFQFAQTPDRLVIAHSGQPVTEFVFRDENILRPYFANVHAPGGLKATRNHPPIAGVDATDHDTMHPGIWLAFGDISGADFWRNKGSIEHRRFTESPAVRGGRLTFATECRLRTADGRTLSALTDRFALAAQTNAWLLVWDATFHSDEADFTFGDQEEMGFGVRVATAITEKNGGVITSSSGLRTAKSTWGQPADWCDYSGTVDGKPIGITVLTDPKHFRPSWWHNRDYGVFVANPFGRAAMKRGDKSAVTVKRGETFRLRFGAAIHSGPAYDAATEFRGFIEPTREGADKPTRN